jgi:hypothetical protein
VLSLEVVDWCLNSGLFLLIGGIALGHLMSMEDTGFSCDKGMSSSGKGDVLGIEKGGI